MRGVTGTSAVKKSTHVAVLGTTAIKSEVRGGRAEVRAEARVGFTLLMNNLVQ